MRLKTIPEDFRVRELLEWAEVPTGSFVVHALHKEKLSTPEALALLVRDGNVDRSAIAYAGLKDRQAITEQFLTIERRAVELRLPNLRVHPVGTTDRPITSRQSRGNAFVIVVRDLLPAKAAQLRRSLPSLLKTGFPNYFDDQRFGSLRHGQGFPMRSVLLGDHERALQQLIAEPSPVAITGDVKLKRTLQLRWGDWEACSRIARGPAYEPLFAHLTAYPDDFRGALEFVPLRQRVIHAFAYQSFLWNRAVSRLLRAGVLSAQRLRISTLAGDLLAWKYLSPDREEKLRAMRTPLFGPEGDGGSEPFRRVMIEEMQQAGLTRQSFAQNEVPGMIWKEEPRDVLIKPADLADVRIEPDAMNAGKVMATLSFSLPRGAYATMMVKRLFAPSWYSQPVEEVREPVQPRAQRAGARQRLDEDFSGDEDGP
ncbi:MAG TPA: tRNA pseudouridine(13) synthase TruD [Planctomycetota bacterium]|nr:tRNA pseudouridine(13) synthase TruD [Planctomycetota bacterium]